MRVGGIGAIVIGVVFLGSSFCLANGGGPVTEEVTKEAVEGEAEISEVMPEKVERLSVSRTSGAALKSPGLAAFLSAICPGLGQIYNEDNIVKIIIMSSVEGLSWVLIGVADMDEVGAFGLAMGRVVSSVDAYNTALEKNRGLSLMIDNEKVVVAIKRHF